MERRKSSLKYTGSIRHKVPVTSKTSKQIIDETVKILNRKESVDEIDLSASPKEQALIELSTTPKDKAFTLDDDVKLGLINRKEQDHIRSVRKQNLEYYTHTERLRKEHDHFIRQVRQTGVTLITNQARTYGFGNPEELHLWANFGQGAPECGPIPGGPFKKMELSIDEETLE